VTTPNYDVLDYGELMNQFDMDIQRPIPNTNRGIWFDPDSLLNRDAQWELYCVQLAKERLQRRLDWE
jgi:hypothetical protein